MSVARKNRTGQNCLNRHSVDRYIKTNDGLVLAGRIMSICLKEYWFPSMRHAQKLIENNVKNATESGPMQPERH
jgi:hypothetical protein